MNITNCRIAYSFRPRSLSSQTGSFAAVVDVDICPSLSGHHWHPRFVRGKILLFSVSCRCQWRRSRLHGHHTPKSDQVSSLVSCCGGSPSLFPPASHKRSSIPVSPSDFSSPSISCSYATEKHTSSDIATVRLMKTRIETLPRHRGRMMMRWPTEAGFFARTLLRPSSAAIGGFRKRTRSLPHVPHIIHHPVSSLTQTTVVEVSAFDSLECRVLSGAAELFSPYVTTC